MIRLKIPQAHCANCGRMATTGFNRPHSLHRTKRIIKINLQRHLGQLVCTRCWRNMRKKALPKQKALA